MTAIKARRLSGSTDRNISDRGIQNRRVARRAAGEGFVLLENDGVLPLDPCKIALYGAGARLTVKGGTGSGDVNARNVVSIEEVLTGAGFSIRTASWLNDFDRINRKAKKEWIDFLAQNVSGKDVFTAIDVYLEHQFRIPDGRLITSEDIRESEADAAVYVIARISGEGADRHDAKGDYRLTDTEFANLKRVSEAYPKTIVVLNAGGLMDLSFMDDLPGINGLIYALQPGVEGGNALADVITGVCNPSGKLTDTWAHDYEDYPSSRHFSHNDGNVRQALYEEDIFVGYRYFDSFNIKPRYEFGFGKSYTDFSSRVLNFYCRGTDISISVSVTNTGQRFSGKEVIQVYSAAPHGKLGKARQALAAFGKTRELKPGEEQTLELAFDLADQSSFDEARASWVLEKGLYTVRVGNSSRNTTIAGYLELDTDVITEAVVNICPLKTPIRKISFPVQEQPVKDPAYPCFTVSADAVRIRHDAAADVNDKLQARKIVEKLSLEELVMVVTGSNQQKNETIGNASQSVPGAAGETTPCLAEKYGVANMVLADGPAGLRLTGNYVVDGNGIVHVRDFFSSVLGAAPRPEITGGTKYYQYCTAMPIGTLLAQTWNVDLVEEVGRTIGTEMEEFGVTLLLAPGMNIHRNPLCGRNFEYFSEDPLVTGKMAAAMTRGVQSLPGIGATIKHFACNNQEADRNFTDSILSERALREIYLKGFEIAVKDAQPMAVMTSYNLINGVRTANSRDLCTQVLRNEWGFKGLVMTDWLATGIGKSSPVSCMEAGNDLMMPGLPSDVDQLLRAAKDGQLDIEKLEGCAANIIDIILKSNRYEDCRPYKI